jgi:hypothetical protein
MESSISQSPILREIWEQGWQNALTQVAINMLRAQIPRSEIASLTGLTLDRVNLIERSVVNPEQSSPIFRDWENLSETSLAQVWLNEEEDIAWQDL